MKLALISLGILTCLELGLWLPGLAGVRKALAVVFALGLGIIGAYCVMLKPGICTALIAVTVVYGIINLLRIIEARLPRQQLQRAVLQTTAIIAGFQTIILGVWWAVDSAHIAHTNAWAIFGLLQIVAAGVLLASTIRHLRTTRSPKALPTLASADLPTLTVAIPARNETPELEACLQSIIASDYPKLEVVVLDDCSQDRTPEIIRNFAQAGVRFIVGREPHAHWLAKNQAYQQLYEESSGDLILYCGVDVRFEPQSLRTLITTMLEKKKSMMCVIPQNVVPAGAQQTSLLVQPMRYLWELSLPRKLFRRPPILSTCWVVRRDLLAEAGNFAAVSASVAPESYFARASSRRDGYSFVRSDSELVVMSTKGFADQVETAVRSGYPQLHRRPEQVLLITVAQLALFVAPFALCVAESLRQHWLIAGIELLTCLLIEVLYMCVVRVTYHKTLLRNLLILPWSALLNAVLLNYSMWKYEFSEVLWKGRNVCLPVLRALPSLPKLQ